MTKRTEKGPEPEVVVQLQTRIEKLRAHLEAIRKGEFDESDPAEDWAAAALGNDDVYARYGVPLGVEGSAADLPALSDEQIDAIALRVVYEGDTTVPHRQGWCEDIGRPFARAIIAALSLESLGRDYAINFNSPAARASQEVTTNEQTEVHPASGNEDADREHQREAREPRRGKGSVP